jgi:hypothetical protein
MVESLCDELLCCLVRCKNVVFHLVPHFKECSPSVKLPTFCGMFSKVLLNVNQECWLRAPLLELHATFLIKNSTSVHLAQV